MEQEGIHNFSDNQDLHNVGKRVVRKVPYLILAAAIIGTLTYAVLSLFAPRYASTVKIIIGEYDTAFNQPVTISQASSRLSLNEDLIKSQVEIIQSSKIILAAMEKLKLRKSSEDSSSSGPQTTDYLNRAPEVKPVDTELEKKFRKFRKSITVERLNRSHVVAIAFSDTDQIFAARAANAIAESYLEWQHRTYVAKNKHASQWLGEEIPKLRKRVAETENAIEVFREKIDLQNTGPERSLDTETLSDVNRQLFDARARRREAEARAGLLKKLADGKSEIVVAPDVLNNTLIQNLLNQKIQARRRISELSATHLSGHPRIQQLRWDLKSINSQINSEAAKILKSLENEVRIARVREQSFLESLGSLKKQTAEIAQNQVKLRALEREAKASRDLLESYMSRYREADTRHYRRT